MKFRALAAALIACCLLGVPSTMQGQTMQKLRIATLPIDTGGQAMYAQDLGYFKKAGLDADVSLINNGAAIAAAVAGGTFDIGQSNLAGLAAARQRGLPFVLIAPSALYTAKTKDVAAIIVGKDTGIKSARDLNGKTIAISGLLSIAQVTTAQWIDKNGGDSKTVKWVELPFAQMTPSLTAGRVDAAELAYPATADAVAAGHRILDSGYEATAPQFVIGGWFCTEEFIKTHPDAVRRFVSVMTDTAHWANAHHDESGQILEKWTKTAVPAAMPRIFYGDRLVASEVQPLIDVSVKYKALAAPMAASELMISPDALRKP